MVNVAGAVELLPFLEPDNGTATEPLRATGTYDVSGEVTPKVTPVAGVTSTFQTIQATSDDSVDHVGPRKNPAKQAVSRGLLSDADGTRTRNHRIDSPVL